MWYLKLERKVLFYTGARVKTQRYGNKDTSIGNCNCIPSRMIFLFSLAQDFWLPVDPCGAANPQGLFVPGDCYMHRLLVGWTISYT